MSSVNGRKSAVALLSVASNATLVLLKIGVGVAIQSVSVISEAIHSGVDLLAACIALFAVRSSAKPADDRHPFGHGKIENVSGTVEAILILGAAVWIVYESVEKLIHPRQMAEASWGVAVMMFSAVVNIVVSRMLFRVGEQADSAALKADAWHLMTDVYTSAGVMLGLGVIWIGEKVFPNQNLHWIDPAAAIGVAVLILKAAYRLTVESGRDLLDVSLPTDEEEWIRDYVRGIGQVVRGFHHLRTRKAGSHRFIQFHLLVNADMSVEASHKLHDDIVVAIKERFPASTVTIHIEPCNASCTPGCVEGCLLDEQERAAVQAQFQHES